MKKIIAFAASMILLTSSLAGATALSTGGVTQNDAGTIKGDIVTPVTASATLIGKMSKGVKLGANYGTGGYALTTKHNSGNTQYGTAYDATAIYKKDVGGTAIAAPSQPDNTAFATDYTAM